MCVSIHTYTRDQAGYLTSSVAMSMMGSRAHNKKSCANLKRHHLASQWPLHGSHQVTASGSLREKRKSPFHCAGVQMWVRTQGHTQHPPPCPELTPVPVGRATLVPQLPPSLQIGGLVDVAQAFGLSLQEAGSFMEHAAFDGILGLSYPSLGLPGTMPVFDSLWAQGRLSRKLFAFYLSRCTRGPGL